MSTPGRPRVLLVALEVHERGGMERALAQLIRHAAGEIDFHVLGWELADELRPLAGFTRVPVPPRPRALSFPAFALASALRARGVGRDLVHTMGAITPLRADVASVQFCHAAFQALPEAQPQWPSLPHRVNGTAMRWMALAAERACYRPSRVRVLAAASRGVQDELQRHYPGVATAVIPNAADLQQFRPDPALRAQVRAELGVADDAVVAIFLGGDWARKGLDVTLDGVALARAAGAAQLSLWVVGVGDVERYAARARQLDPAPWCTFHGFNAHPERLLAAADAFVSPTIYEAFPLAALEAAAAGLPVVATNVNGIAELVEHGREGMIVTRDGRSIADALGTLAHDASVRRAMGEAARSRAAGYTWEGVARQTVELYDGLLGGSSRRSAEPA